MTSETRENVRTIEKHHRFLDEAGDPTFFGKGGGTILGEEGVSLSFSLGMVKFENPLEDLRRQVVELQGRVETDDYVNRVPSIVKRIQAGGFFFHAKDDVPEVRERMYRWIRQTNCSLEMVVGRKIPALFIRKHNGREAEFYADLLSHLLKTKLMMGKRLVINVAARGKTTRNQTLEMAMEKARERFGKRRHLSEINSEVVFNIQNPRTEPLLSVTDYLTWAVQRVFERGDARYYDFVQERVALVVDLYDQENYGQSRNYYTRKNPLSAANRLCPPAP